jgi:hypothetical protein
MPEDNSLLNRLSESATAEAGMEPFLFHASGEPIEGDMHPGGYDGVFWTASCPAVAQVYIPRTGGASLVAIPSYQLHERVRPSLNSDLYKAAIRLAGEQPDVEWSGTGEAKSWSIPQRWPTYGDMLTWFRDTLGYAEAAANHPFWARTHWEGGGTVFAPAAYKMPGSLMVVDAKHLNFYDYARGREGDLQSPDHNKLDMFRRVEAAGYQGIVINDFCQSPAWGNVGHLSWGVFPSALRHVKWARIPATAFDWEETPGGLNETVTPEFRAAFEHAHAAVRGQPAPR